MQTRAFRKKRKKVSVYRMRKRLPDTEEKKKRRVEGWECFQKKNARVQGGVEGGRSCG